MHQIKRLSIVVLVAGVVLGAAGVALAGRLTTAGALIAPPDKGRAHAAAINVNLGSTPDAIGVGESTTTERDDRATDVRVLDTKIGMAPVGDKSLVGGCAPSDTTCVAVVHTFRTGSGTERHAEWTALEVRGGGDDVKLLTSSTSSGSCHAESHAALLESGATGAVDGSDAHRNCSAG